MTATATAARVLTWAAEQRGALPTGPLWDAAGLADPPADVRDGAVRLAYRTAALLGGGHPPFGSAPRPGAPAEPIGLGVVFLAAAVGGREQPGHAARLARALPPAKRGHRDGAWYDLAARHGLVSAVLTELPGSRDQLARKGDDAPLAEVLLEASPLTTVLYRPTLRALEKDTTTSAEITAEELLGQSRGRAVLADGLAGWTESARVLGWRSRLLSRLRHKHLEAVLDVYFTARTRFAAQWDERVGWAARELSRGTPDPLAIETLRFWAPLAAIERAQRPRPLSALRPLLAGHEDALRHLRGLRLDQGGGIT